MAKNWGIELAKTPGALERKRIELTKRARKQNDLATAKAQQQMMIRTEGRRTASRKARARPLGYNTAKPASAAPRPPSLRQAIEDAWDKAM